MLASRLCARSRAFGSCCSPIDSRLCIRVCDTCDSTSAVAAVAGAGCCGPERGLPGAEGAALAERECPRDSVHIDRAVLCCEIGHVGKACSCMFAAAASAGPAACTCDRAVDAAVQAPSMDPVAVERRERCDGETSGDEPCDGAAVEALGSQLLERECVWLIAGRIEGARL